MAALFEIDVTDPAAVASRASELRERLRAPITAPSVPPKSSPERAVDELARQRDRLRLQFLELPAELRERLIEQDQLERERRGVAEQAEQARQLREAAERERSAALLAAQQAATAAERELAVEEARLQTHRAELAAMAQAWNTRSQADLDARGRLASRYSSATSGEALRPTQADALYQSIRTDLSELRERADQALSDLAAPSSIAGVTSELELQSPRFDQFAEQRNHLVRLRADIAAEEAEMARHERDDRYRAAASTMESLQNLQTLRVALLARLSPERREQVTGLNAEGLQRLRGELSHVTLMARWYPEQRRHAIAGLREQLRNVLTAGGVGLRALAFVALLVAYVYVQRRRRAALTWLRLRLVGAVDNRAIALRLNSAMLALSAVAGELLLLGTVYLLFDRILLHAAQVPEVAVLRKLAFAYAWYRLALAAIHRVLLNSVRRYRRVDLELDRKILRSVRVVALFALVMTAYLIISQALLGRGALYGTARTLAWAGTALIGYYLIRMWREDVAKSYLSMYPEGRLASLVRGTSGHSHGLIVALLAFGFVAARGLWTWLRDTALRFEQTRKALAYLLRRRLERQAEREAGNAPDPRQLPDELTGALSEDPVTSPLRVQHFPAQDEVLAMVQGLAGGQQGGLVALVGDRGVGKTTWLNALAEQLGEALPLCQLDLQERLLDPAELIGQLSSRLELPQVGGDGELIARLNEGPRRVVIVDLAQNLMLRAVGGLDCYECLLGIGRATAGRVIWILAFARWPFEFLQRLHPGQDIYHRIIHLNGWSERQISDLINHRMKAAGYAVDYSELQLDAALPSRSPRPLDEEGLSNLNAEQEPPSDRYHRIIWDYADGNPRIALHFWRYSLVPAGEKRVKVRLFSTPSQAVLEMTGLQTRFLLACLVQHENLTASEAGRSMRLDEAACAASLETLRSKGMLVAENGRYRVDSHWNRAVLRFLQRKKLLVV
ncbi:hypothetical protein [Solimonas sp. SE-A11]|uniref:hypothetical protein n=1 Tax=Solimonas sp. SE-A11 TaxID=3054954 RepID=UPI00259CC554|nr:hypothetical protein [Solimonas sp. SE-A11]MDM4773002.1 hypothetical protein [Solimonas sp. SE-A11]